MNTPVVQILVDGEPALTVEMAAARYRLGRSSMRSVFTRHGIQPVAYLDADQRHLTRRRGLYLVADLDEFMASLPGRGANLRALAAGGYARDDGAKMPRRPAEVKA